MGSGTVTDQQLRLIGNEHWREAYRVLVATVGGEWRSFGSVDSFTSRTVSHTFVNGCVILDSTVAPDVTAAVHWLDERASDYLVRLDLAVATPEILSALTSAGLEADETWRMPGMVLSGIPAAPTPPRNVTVRRVDAPLASELPALLAAIDSPHWRFLNTLAEPSVESDQLAIYAAYLDGRFCATSAVIRTGDTCGIYAVGTAEWAQRRGAGTAVTWATLEHARLDWGCTAAVLQSSPVGIPVYRAMGFRTVAQYQLLARPT